jgi:hypothetical protein
MHWREIANHKGFTTLQLDDDRICRASHSAKRRDPHP